MDVVFSFVESRVYLGLVQYDDLACGMVILVCRRLMVARLRIYLCKWIVPTTTETAAFSNFKK